MNDFNGLAGIYDWIARSVFFGSIMKAQLHYLDRIREGDKVLILGGGTGELLAHIYQRNLQVDYVEPSEQMIEMAKSRLIERSDIKVVFHAERFEDFNTKKKYDVVICAFFLDLFPEDKLITVIKKTKTLMRTGSKLIVTDFQIIDGLYWQIALSKLMHLFFRITVALESRRLLSHDIFLRSIGFQPNGEKLYFSKFIFSRIYLGK